MRRVSPLHLVYLRSHVWLLENKTTCLLEYLYLRVLLDMRGGAHKTVEFLKAILLACVTSGERGHVSSCIPALARVPGDAGGSYKTVEFGEATTRAYKGRLGICNDIATSDIDLITLRSQF